MEDIEDRKVLFITAKLAFEKGFDINCGLSYDIHGVEVNWTTKMFYCWKPTLSLLQDWLREIHNIQVYCYSSSTRNGIYSDYVVYVNNKPLNDARHEEYQKYGNALEFGLREALKLIK